MRRLAYSPQTQVLVPNIFGDGSDGDVVISTAVELSRDMNYRSLRITAAGSLNTNGQRVFVKNNLLNEGVIHCNGQDGSTFSGGTGVGLGTLAASTDGGSGRNNVGAGGDGVDAGVGWSSSNCRGGNGGSATGGTAGAGGQHNSGGFEEPVGFNNIINALTGALTYNGSSVMLEPGCGGGGGGFGTSATGYSGAGGSGGGSMVLAAKYINNTAGIISADGGNGAAAAGTGNLGGGGGGGGGIIFIICLSIAQGTIRANGGTGGAGVGSGTAGSAGQSGVYKIINGV